MSRKSTIIAFLLVFVIIANAGVFAQGRFNKFDPRSARPSLEIKDPPAGVDEMKQKILSKLDTLTEFLTKYQIKITNEEELDEDTRTWLLARISARRVWVDTQKNALDTAETLDALKIIAKNMRDDWRANKSLSMLYLDAVRFRQFAKVHARLSNYEKLLLQKEVDTTVLKEYLDSAQDYRDEAKATLLQVTDEITAEGYRTQSHDQLKQGYAQLRLAITEAKKLRDTLKNRTPTHEQ